MKFISLFILCSLSSNCFSQTSSSSLKNTFTLNGQVTGRDTGRMILIYQDSTNNWISDTTWLKNGKFTFEGSIDQPTRGILGDPKFVNGGEVNSVGIFIEPKKMAVQLVEGDYENADLKGSDVQDEYKVFLNEEIKVKLKWKEITDEYDKLITLIYSNETVSTKSENQNEKLGRLRLKINQRDQEIEDIKYMFIAQFPNSYFSAYLLSFFQKRPSLEFQKAAYEKFSEQIKNSRHGKYLSDAIIRRSLVDIGVLAPDFSSSNPEEKKFTLSEMKGKIVLIDFWASWCIPCREGIPDLKKYYDQYHSQGFEVVTISIDRRKSDWEKAVLEEKIPCFHNVYVNDEITKRNENVYRPIPSQILINKEGKIIWKKTSDIEVDSKSLSSVLLENFAN